MKKQINTIFGYRVKTQIALFSALAIFAASCEKEPVSRPGSEEIETLGDITEILASYGEPDFFTKGDEQKGEKNAVTFSTLNVALAQTGLMGIVASSQLTVFAPTDDAFAKLGLNARNISTVPNLREILLYHVVAGKVLSTQLSNGFYGTGNGSSVEIKLSSAGVMVNGANVVKADVKARNGIIHVIDNVLFPPDKNLVELAISLNPEFSILVQAVVKAGLDEVLATGGPFTVFAPTNAAFIALLDELGATSLDDISAEVLTKVLLYHVAEGRVYSSDLISGPVPTLNGSFEVTVETLTITDFNGRTSGLIPSLLNVQATNGVIHVIDRVILPDLN